MSWGGQQIDLITPGNDFGWQHYHYDLQVAPNVYELNHQYALSITAVNNNGVGALIDNLQVSYVVVGA